MIQKQNSILSKPFWYSLLWKQNGYHQHGVLLHTLRVTYHVLKHKEYKMFIAALLHDIGKPLSLIKNMKISLKKSIALPTMKSLATRSLKTGHWSAPTPKSWFAGIILSGISLNTRPKTLNDTKRKKLFGKN